MKPDITVTPTQEIYVETKDLNISAYQWANKEGVTVSAHATGEALTPRFSASLTWEEIDALIIALTTARSV